MELDSIHSSRVVGFGMFALRNDAIGWKYLKRSTSAHSAGWRTRIERTKKQSDIGAGGWQDENITAVGLLIAE